ncbi:hypothetical protein [Aidingimonas lacisalsi]|uniref:hypothetical protein n=1 Tax=Aidingimonas lacisalsi TaxID=2604086 RepID=UPI00191BD879|nr:hypothetical protein [Aidingimonas lacisalsi]
MSVFILVVAVALSIITVHDYSDFAPFFAMPWYWFGTWGAGNLVHREVFVATTGIKDAPSKGRQFLILGANSHCRCGAIEPVTPMRDMNGCHATYRDQGDIDYAGR